MGNIKISTKGIYAIEAMTDLAIHSKDKVESIKNVAERRHLSEKYLEQILGALRKGKLIVSTRGANGGYRLARDPKEITMLDILQSVEKNLVPVECLDKETDCRIECGRCVTREMWSQLWNQIVSTSSSVTLYDIMEESES